MKNLIITLISAVSLLLVSGCRVVCLLSEAEAPKSVLPGQAFDVLVISSINFCDTGKTEITHEFRRDSMVMAASLPKGFRVERVDYQYLGSISQLCTLAQLITGKMYDIHTFEKMSDSDEIKIQNYLSKSALAGKCLRNEQFDEILASSCDTARIGLKFQSFTGDLKFKVPAKTKYEMVNDGFGWSAYYFICRFRIIASLQEGRYNLGFFTGLEPSKYLAKGYDIKHRVDADNGDTILACFDGETAINVTSMPEVAKIEEIGDNNDGYFSINSSPNPMGSNGTIKFFIPNGSQSRNTSVSLFDIRGRLIKSKLINGSMGWNNISWDKFAGSEVQAGRYIIRMDMQGKSVSSPMMIIK
ncbi:MAG: T9SS type A sorting domain-containing protein [Fibrobacteres bacterium]|nr:T9SS type A sorting domain-containing protein [Fibrobacterota bacterium]